MEYPVDQGHPYGAYAAVMAASERINPRLPIQIHNNGLYLYDGEVDIQPGIEYQVHEGFIDENFDPRTHPGIIEKFRFLDLGAGLGRDILFGGQDRDTGLWYLEIKDLEIINVQGVPTPFHFPHKDYSDRFWGEAHILEGTDGLTIILVPQAPYVENY